MSLHTTRSVLVPVWSTRDSLLDLAGPSLSTWLRRTGPVDPWDHIVIQPRWLIVRIGNFSIRFSAVSYEERALESLAQPNFLRGKALSQYFRINLPTAPSSFNQNSAPGK